MENPAELALIDSATLQRLAQFFPIKHGGSTGAASPPDDAPVDPRQLQEKLSAALRRHRKLRARYEGDPTGLRDTTRSGRDFSLGAMLKHAGFSFPEMRAVLIGWQHGAGKDHANDARYFLRIWDRTADFGATTTTADGRPVIQSSAVPVITLPMQDWARSPPLVCRSTGATETLSASSA